jgi:iron-sulfur cluster assembly protein
VVAIRRLVAEASDADILGIRIAACGGCEGLKYEMGLEANARDGDAVIHIEDLLVFVDEESKPWLDGAEVDFCDTPSATGFVFNHPGQCGSCGKQGRCGS